MKIRGKLAEILIDTAPELYKAYAVIENGQAVIYVELLKALYGLLLAAVLFYKKLLKDLQSKGFVLNRYDPCVVNKMIKGKQATIVWWVDDLKISHVDSKIVDEIIRWLRFKYEDPAIKNMPAHRGKVHEFLGMKFDYSTAGEVTCEMIEYVEKMIKDFDKYFKDMKKVSSPAALHLFQVRENVEKLNKEKAKVFHNMVARGLFLTKRARGDIHTAISFLTTRVQGPDTDDWNKLKRLMKYLAQTNKLFSTLRADDLTLQKWHIDGSHGTHPDCKGHTGGALTLGKGTLCNTSRKQKLNTRSSTETELVSVDDMMPSVLWTKYFLEEQGYGSAETVIKQDNKSTILLENHAKMSSTKRTKHINMRYFFITDKVKRGEVKIEHCPADDMVADYFTKPLQGKLFVKFRKAILNIK